MPIIIRGDGAVADNVTVGGTIEIQDSSGSVNPSSTKIRLYKKSGDDTLYSRSISGEIDLTYRRDYYNQVAHNMDASGVIIQYQVDNFVYPPPTIDAIGTPINKITTVVSTINIGNYTSQYIQGRSSGEIFHLIGGVDGNVANIAILSNGTSYTFSGTVTLSGSPVTNGVLWPYEGGLPVPSSSGRVDLYSFTKVDGFYFGVMAADYNGLT